LAVHAYKVRENAGGNFCGHNPLNPNLTLDKPIPKGVGGAPRVLTLCVERITGYYHRPRKVLPSLDLANGSDRQQRSERRESCLRTLAALLKFCDVTSLRVGIPTHDGFINLPLSVIASHSGMGQKRVERAVKDLKAAGLLTVAQPRQRQPDGTWRGLAAVKAVSKHLFAAFGLTRMLEIERKKASKRLKAKLADRPEKPSTLTSKGRFGLFMGGLAGQLQGKKKRGKAKGPIRPSGEPPDFERRKALSSKAMEVKAEHPTWTSAQCFHEAENRLSGRRSG
jgi:hypothetical protein